MTPDFGELFANDPAFFIILFIASLVGLLAIFIVVKAVSSSKKKKLRGQGDMAELTFEASVISANRFIADSPFTGYKLYAVNGGAGNIVGKSIFVAPGICQIDLEYLVTAYSAGGKRSVTASYGRQTIQVMAEAGTQYRVSCDEKTGSYSVSQM